MREECTAQFFFEKDFNETPSKKLLTYVSRFAKTSLVLPTLFNSIYI